MKIVVALGGNALQYGTKAPTCDEQIKIIKDTSFYLCNLINEGHDIVITHGNGPQVGRILLQNESMRSVLPPMPLDVCGAMSQGMIGYHLQQALRQELRNRNINKEVVSIITQVEIDPNDEAFLNPTKPIGQFYSKEESDKLIENKNYVMVEDSGRGYRRVVPSPTPSKIIELDIIKKLSKEYIVIAVGGGGIPVVNDGKLKGVEAVIDKDLASNKLAQDLNADILLILTAVEKVYMNYGKDDEQELNFLRTHEAIKLINKGHFPPGSMCPKINAAVDFASSQKGRKAIITCLDKGIEAIKGKTGTHIEL